jgi:hypothetical protein
MSVCVGFRYIKNCKFLSLRCVVRSRKLMDSCCSFYIVKFMVDCSLLNSLSVWCMFVLFWSYIISMSSTYLKYAIICCFVRIGWAFYTMEQFWHNWNTWWSPFAAETGREGKEWWKVLHCWCNYIVCKRYIGAMGCLNTILYMLFIKSHLNIIQCSW